MMKGMYWWLAGAGVVTLVVVSKVSGLISLSDELEIETDAKVHKVTLTGFELRVYVKIKNPTKEQVSIGFPFVKIIYQQQGLVNGTKKTNEITLTSSQLSNTKVLIAANKVTALPEPIILKGSWLNIGMNAPTAIKEYRTNGRLNILVRTRSVVTSINKEIVKDQSLTIGNGEEQS